MATRGTYRVDGKLLYNHWDNYPEGAALQLLECIKKHGDLKLFSVIRGMDKIKETNSIYDGPAEYHYIIEKGTIKCYSIPPDKDLTEYHSQGTIKECINEHIKTALEKTDNPEDYQLVETPYGLQTISDCKKDVNEKFLRAVELYEQGHIGNSSSSFNEAFRIANVAGIEIDELKKEYLEKYSPGFAASYKHEDSKYFDSIINEAK